MLRVGVLLPRSTLYPSIGLDILNGIKACLYQYGSTESFHLMTENIGFGTNREEVYGKAEKLLIQENADIIIVIAEDSIREILEPLFTSTNKMLMMVNAGAGFPDKWIAAPTTLVHSLNFCLHARLTGKLAALETNKQAANLTSFYDGGYRQCYSFLNSYQEQGGIPRFTHVTRFKEEEFTLAPLADFLKQETGVKTLLCLFAGDLAAKFYREVASLQQQYNLGLYVSPMMLDGSLSDFPGEPLSIQHTKGYAPWIPGLINENNTVFESAYRTIAGKKSNYFSLLGWETGLLLHECLQQYRAGVTQAANIVSALGQVEFKSPRGWLKLDPASHHTYGPSWLVNCHQNMELETEGAYPDIENEWKQFTSETIVPGESSGWRNTYLCI